jgi:hypothetical protein
MNEQLDDIVQREQVQGFYKDGENTCFHIQTIGDVIPQGAHNYQFVTDSIHGYILGEYISFDDKSGIQHRIEVTTGRKVTSDKVANA